MLDESIYNYFHGVDLLMKLHIEGEDDRDYTAKCITIVSTQNVSATVVGTAIKVYILTLLET